MPTYKIMIARPCSLGTICQDVANFVSNAWKVRFTDSDISGKISELIDCPIQRFPTDVARNCLVQVAREHRVDFLYMLDEDSSPNYDFFKHAFQFLINQPKPSVIGCPYLSGDGEVQVYRFIPAHSPDPVQPAWKILRVPRADAFVRTGQERIASIGTHTICYDMRVFDQISQPYFRYSYEPNHTALAETEEMYCHRNLMQCGVPIWVSWDHWSGHWKPQRIGPLEPIEPDQLPDFWKARAKEYFLYHEKGRKELADAQAGIVAQEPGQPVDTVPHDVHGWLNDPSWITRCIGRIPDGGQYLEVGCWQGKSAIHAAKQVQLSGKKITVWSVDTFEGSPDETAHQYMIESLPEGGLHRVAQENIKRHGVHEIVKLVKGESTRVAEHFEDGSLDAVFLDGGHSYGAVYADVMAWLPKVKPGGILAGDDYHEGEFPGVVRAVKELLPKAVVLGRTWEVRK